MANTYISRTFGTPTNSAIWTLSFWIKRSALSPSNSQKIFSAGSGSTDRTEISFSGGVDGINIYRNIGGSTASCNSTMKFRDTNAWYHLVFQNNNGTVAVYVNGEAETMSSTSLGTNKINLASTIHIFGDQVASGQNFDGLMSHIHFVDGTIYAPTVFGSTDSVTGEWQINTSPSFTPGNNGFTILKDGNTITDQSANSNNFSLSSGTLTKSEDCPDNVFCTLNPLISTVPTAGSNSGTTGTFTNGNLTWTSTNAVWNSRGSGNMFVDTGKFYWETKMNTGGDFNAFIGISPTTTVHEYFDGTMGKTGNFAYYKNGQKYIGSSASSYGDAWVAGDIIGTALDATNSKLYFSKNGVWQNSGDPTSGSTGTGAIPINANTLYAPRCTIHNMGMSFNFGQGNFGTTAITTNSGNGYAGAEGASKFNYTVPSGYSALSTKGLNE